MKIGYDNNGNGDILDSGDVLQVSDDFNSNVMTLTYDSNGNLTSDGVYQYVYDGWNRLRKVQRRAAHAGQGDDVTTLGTYAYWPDNRRASKTVAHCGIEAVANDGGDTVVYFYYSNKWQILETRNGSNQATRQWVWGTRYVDEVLFMDVNGDPATSNICDADDPNRPTGTRRYFYHQDRDWNVVALSEYGGDGLGINGRLAERYAYTPYGEFVVLKGDSGSGELGRALPASSVGNIFFHQGLPFDQEKACYQNRHREYQARMQRFARRDPLRLSPTDAKSRSRSRSVDAGHLYAAYGQDPQLRVDPRGLYSSTERCWCLWNPLCCAEIVGLENDVTDIVSRDMGGGPIPDDSLYNALQHCTWSCAVANAVFCNCAQTKGIGDAHEVGDPNPTGSANDLKNNAQGRRAGGCETSPDYTDGGGDNNGVDGLQTIESCLQTCKYLALNCRLSYTNKGCGAYPPGGAEFCGSVNSRCP